MFKRGVNGSYLKGNGWMGKGADGMIKKGKRLEAKEWEGK
jgi:hypothetical protein